MREIKFRAWDGKRMSYPETLHFGVNQTSVVGRTPDDSRPCLYHVESVMQYTGLKDKNGREIYEGDIVRTKQTAWGYVAHLLVCDWDDEHSCFRFKCVATEGDTKGTLKEGQNWSPKVMNGFCEVIGNIYENPEFLK